MTAESIASVYVLDTHALYWYWTEPDRLGPTADSAFRALERREGIGLVPFIVVAELHHLASKRGAQLSVEHVLRLIDGAPALRLEPLTRRHLVTFGRLTQIPEMHDRLIAAVGLLHDAVVVTRDPDIQAHPLVRSAW